MTSVRERVINRLGSIREEVGHREPREEGRFMRAVDRQTARIPTTGFLGLALGSMVLSAVVEFFGRTESSRNFGNFIGLWAPSFLLMGIYNRILRLEQWQEQR